MKKDKVEFEKTIILAPMAGISDLPFRIICSMMNCDVVYSEMVSAKALYYRDRKTEKLLEISKEEKPVAIQIFGSDADIMARAAYHLNNRENAILDINMGCPAPKIIKNGDGSALMKSPKIAGEIIKAVVKESVKPVTVKIRKGWDGSSVNAVEIAKIAEKNGASAVAVHGRTRDQFYSGKADWDIIKQVKEALSIPVVGNGDVFGAESAKAMFDYTKCDAIMIGRGAQGNPWVFNQISEYMKTGKSLQKPSLKERVDTIIYHMDLLIDCKGEYIGIREMRKHIAWYIKGYKNSARIRDDVNRINTAEEMKIILNDYLSENSGITST
ncbi:MAG: tRNA dihydrouridine synthase DusB [Alkaliphilus sp.]